MTQDLEVEEQLLDAIETLHPVAQLFIADEQMDTRLCINNYFSALAPEIEAPVRGQFFLFDEKGRFLSGQEFQLAYHGSFSVSVVEILKQSGLRAPLGLAACLLYSENAQQFSAYMDSPVSHFFACYEGRKGEGLAVVHPQVRFGDEPFGEFWRSSQSIVVSGLKSLDIYQANPTRMERKLTYELRDLASKGLVAQRSLCLAAHSAAKLRFAMEELQCESGELYLTADPLPAPNGKSLLMRRFLDGRFTISHG